MRKGDRRGLSLTKGALCFEPGALAETCLSSAPPCTVTHRVGSTGSAFLPSLLELLLACGC